jgi:hypothetical protein
LAVVFVYFIHVRKKFYKDDFAIRLLAAPCLRIGLLPAGRDKRSQRGFIFIYLYIFLIFN